MIGAMLPDRARAVAFFGMLLAAVAGSCLAAEPPPPPPQQQAYDVVVYGGTSGGVIAAVKVARLGKSVVLIEPSRHLGGLSSGGLGATDIGNKAAIGGMSREFYRRVGKAYGEEEAWKFEPHVAERVFDELAAEAKVPVVKGERLDLKDGVKKEGNRIVSIRMESGRTFAGKMFIDTSYEGDLMAKAGVAYRVGREANADYNETLDGVQIGHPGHQFIKPVDPYVRPGDPSSGLLPGVHAGGPGKQGEGDRRVQAYNFRMCTTDLPQNQVEWPKPKDYDPARYELLLRNFEAGDHRVPWNPVAMPNHKTDVNNNFAFSTDYLGANYDYPDGDYATRQRVFDDHVSYQQGLMWTLANSPRVPPDVQQHFRKWKPAKDEFTDNANWPHQLYVREARRMAGEYVMTQHNCQGRAVAADPVGLAAYNMDSHNTQRYVDESGHARNEGDVQVGVSPYPISYRSIVPREAECANLLVPVCLSSTHIAYGSIRMEPVFMVLGHSAATAAAMAIDGDVPVQKVDYSKLNERLLADGQVLAWTGPKAQPGGASGAIGPQTIDPAKLPGVVVDDGQARLEGDWVHSASQPSFVGDGYLHDGNEAKGHKSARFVLLVKAAGEYEVRLSYSPNPNRATNVPVIVSGFTGGGSKKVTVNERQPPAIDRLFVSLGTFRFDTGAKATVEISNAGTDGHVIVDAVQLVPAK